jgi:hypothetical protein
MRSRYLMVMLSLTMVASVSAEPRSGADAFNATVDARLIRPEGCESGAYRCGDAVVDGFGSASWEYNVTSFERISNACVEYTAVSTFTLEDASVLTLNEAGTACGPGNSFFATPPFSWGNPDRATTSWDIASGTGQFEGLTGSGSASFKSAGAAIRGIYEG